jgi:hypothetical protein
MTARDPSLAVTAWRRRLLIRMAERNGYRLGDNVQGGGNACSAALVRALSSRGLLDDPYLFFHTRIPEDAAITIMCYGVGFVAMDYNGPGQVFAAINNGMPDSPENILQSNYAIVHSLKADPRWTEDEIRSAFAKERQKIGVPYPS